MDAVDMGLAQHHPALGGGGPLCRRRRALCDGRNLRCPSLRPAALCSFVNDELSPAALAARVVLGDCVRELVQSGHWIGAAKSHIRPFRGAATHHDS